MNEPRDCRSVTLTDWIVHIAGAALLPGLLLFGRLYAPYADDGPVICLWRRLFGWHCLGCGLTRALCLFATGHWAAAVRANVLIVPGLMAALIVFVRGTTWLIRRSLRTSNSGRLSRCADSR
jgi:hypothetical protein